MNVVVLAGGELSVDDPLVSAALNGGNKAHLPLGGKPMLQWVLDALGGSDLISRVILIGQSEEAGFKCLKPMVTIPDQGGLVENLIAGVRRSVQLSPDEGYTLIASGDIPLISTEMVDWVIRNGVTVGAEITYHVVSEEVMGARFPGSKRTFVPLKDVRVCGGDLNLIANHVIDQHQSLWLRLADTRKSPLKQAAIFGPVILAGLALRRFTLDELAKRISRRLKLNAQVVISQYAELGMDIDKLHQYEMVLNEIEAS
jgi:molybdopterin-guanine dinucleotide biosynthesis protein A